MGLVNYKQPYHPRITRLFYANLRVSFDHYGTPSASSYLFGRVLYIDVEDLASFLEASDTLAGLAVYAFQNWPHGFGTYRSHRQWFKIPPSEDGSEVASTAHLPALHRLLFLAINHILFPHGEPSDLARPGGLFYLRLFILKDGKVNLGSLILQNMHRVTRANTGMLPYGHLIEGLMRRARIPMPKTLWGNRITEDQVAHPRNLLMELPSFGWVEQEGGPLIPDPDYPVNGYIFQEHAAANQYSPVREASPPPDDGPAVEAVMPPQAQLGQQLGELHERLNNIEATLQTISDTLAVFAGAAAVPPA